MNVKLKEPSEGKSIKGDTMLRKMAMTIELGETTLDEDGKEKLSTSYMVKANN